MVNAPGYWRNETSGALAPVVEKYLRGGTLTPTEVMTIRAYLRQWVAGDFAGPGVAILRRRVRNLHTDADVRGWLADAIELGIDPL